MKSLIFLVFIGLLVSCKMGTKHPIADPLTPNEFIAKLNTSPNAVILDARTSEEYERGHIPGAVLADWNSGDHFDEVALKFDRESPMFVYCLSGGRSQPAAEHLRSKGFKHVYELRDGFQAWQAAKLPVEQGEESKPSGDSKSLSLEEYQALTSTNPKILIDFYAEWCGPCKLMKPHLESIAEAHKDEIEIVKINADQNRELCIELGIKGLPTLVLYEEGKETWKNVGYLDKDGILEAIHL